MENGGDPTTQKQVPIDLKISDEEPKQDEKPKQDEEQKQDEDKHDEKSKQDEEPKQDEEKHDEKPKQDEVKQIQSKERGEKQNKEQDEIGQNKLEVENNENAVVRRSPRKRQELVEETTGPDKILNDLKIDRSCLKFYSVGIKSSLSPHIGFLADRPPTIRRNFTKLFSSKTIL